MSIDSVDDIQEAEDHIGLLGERLAQLVYAVEEARSTGKLTGPGTAVLDQAMANARKAQEPWCRPTCADHDHDDPTDEDAEFCGRPAHPERED